MPDEHQDELNDLLNEESGALANRAADASLQLLGLLGAMQGDVTGPEYRGEVAMALVRVLFALTAVRHCIAQASPELSDRGRLEYITRLVGTAFDLDPEPVIAELIRESVAA